MSSMVHNNKEHKPLLQTSETQILTSWRSKLFLSSIKPTTLLVNRHQPQYPSWWGWVVVMSSFYCIAILDGVGYTTGVMLDSLLSDLGGGRAQISLVGSLQVGVYCLVGPLVGKLVTTHGCSKICVTGAFLASLGLLTASFAPSLSILMWCYSVITGLGFGLMYIPSVVVSAPYFTDRRALAIGICLCGSGFGTFSLAPLSQFILENYGWRWVMRTFSFLSMIAILAGTTMVTPECQEDQDQSRSRPRQRLESDASLINEKSNKMLSILVGEDLANSSRLVSYLLFTLSDFLAFTAIYIPYTHLPPLAKYRNVSPGDAAFLISAGGICNTVGRLLGGWMSDRPQIQPLTLLLVSLTLLCGPTIMLGSCWAYWTFLVSFGSFGLLSGVIVGCTNPILLDMLGLKCLSQAFSFVSALRGIAAMAGPPAAGVVVDTLQAPAMALYMCGGLVVASVIVAGVSWIALRIQKRRDNYIEL